MSHKKLGLYLGKYDCYGPCISDGVITHGSEVNHTLLDYSDWINMDPEVQGWSYSKPVKLIIPHALM